ncbi:unnamed protein product [Cunninghamella echinulata]
MDCKSRTSRSATLEETNEELSLWKEICTSLIKLETIQHQATDVLNNINKLHTTVPFENGISSILHQRLKEYYRNGIDLSSNEIKTIHDIIEKVSVLIALRDASEYNAVDGKRKKRRHELDEKPISASSPSKKTKSNILPVGTSVAAKQPTQQKDARNEEWILATVIGYLADKNKYHVEDVDQDEYGQIQRYMLPPKQVIPIPERIDHRNEFAPGKHVLALYPGTTCFYKAIVITSPSKNKDMNALGMYKIQFEDDNNEIRYAKPERVLEMPKPSK